MTQNNDAERINALARWAIIGRLAASLFHEINNPMQTIQGATGLAIESLDQSDSSAAAKNLGTYLNLTLQESDRIMQLIARARRVYRPENDQAEAFDLNDLLQEMILLTREEMHRKKIAMRMELDSSLPLIYAQFSELSLAFLCPLLEISDAIQAIGGGDLLVSSYTEEETTIKEACIYVKLSTQSLHRSPEEGFQFIVCRKVVAEYHGTVEEIVENGRLCIIITLPFSSILHTALESS